MELGELTRRLAAQAEKAIVGTATDPVNLEVVVGGQLREHRIVDVVATPDGRVAIVFDSRP